MPVPTAGLLAAWLSACLAGTAHPEELEAALGGDELHLFTGLDPGPLSPTLALGALRRRGAVSATVALPAPGDPVGLAGPPDFNAEALVAGEAVLVAGSGLGVVPSRTGDVVTWEARPAERARPLDPGEADADLRRALSQATHALVELDVARWQPEIADALTNLRHRPPPPLPRALARWAGTVDRAAVCLEILALAQEPDGALVSAHETERRRQALVPLDQAARRALVASCSVPG